VDLQEVKGNIMDTKKNFYWTNLEKQEANPEEIESKADHKEVHMEEAVKPPVRALKKQHGDQSLALGRRWKPKKRTQVNGGCWKKLAGTCRGMTRCAIPAWCKGHASVIKDRARTVLQQEPLQEERTRKLAMEQGTETLRSNYVWERIGQPATASDGAEDSSYDWKAWEMLMRPSGRP
jgi:hypothetical protein